MKAQGSIRSVADALWGEIKFSRPLLQELAATPAMRRLEGIWLAGASRYLLPEKRPITRYAHSLGVMHVLGMVGAGLEEQVAGLLHDIPHTAFSHTADIVFPNAEYNYHERFQREMVLASNIPEILSRHGVNLRAALEPDSFPLLEQPLPNLCADRIDYALRDLHGAGMITAQEASRFIEHLDPTREGLVVRDIDSALWFSRLFLEANDLFWTGPLEAGAYWVLAGAIKRAYQLGAFTDADFFSTDDEAMRKLRSLDDNRVQAYLTLLQPGTLFYETDEGQRHFTTHMKQRAIDPFVWVRGHEQPQRLSRLSEEYAQQLNARAKGRSTEYRLWSPAITPEIQEQIADDGHFTQ